MNTLELAALLRSMGVRADAYSIGADRDESYCLLSEQEGWHVYYSERGHRSGESVHASEAEGCQALLEMLRRDGGVGMDGEAN